MSVIRTRRANNFTVIPNEIINDPDIAGADLGLLVFLLSKPSDWKVSINALAGLGRFGCNSTVCEALKRLRGLGYAHLKRSSDGTTVWTIYDVRGGAEMLKDAPPEGEPEQENPKWESPNLGKPKGGNPNVLQRTDLTKNGEEQRTDDSSLRSESSPAREKTRKKRATTEPDPPSSPSPTGTRLPADWQIPKLWGQWAMDEFTHLSRENVLEIAAQFRDYWIAVPGQKGKKLDWEATWRNWCRRDQVRYRPRQQFQAAPEPVRRAQIAEAHRQRSLELEP